MNKYLIQLAAIILIPALLTDPSLAADFQDLGIQGNRLLPNAVILQRMQGEAVIQPIASSLRDISNSTLPVLSRVTRLLNLKKVMRPSVLLSLFTLFGGAIKAMAAYTVNLATGEVTGMITRSPTGVAKTVSRIAVEMQYSFGDAPNGLHHHYHWIRQTSKFLAEKMHFVDGTIVHLKDTFTAKIPTGMDPALVIRRLRALHEHVTVIQAPAGHGSSHISQLPAPDFHAHLPPLPHISFGHIYGLQIEIAIGVVLGLLALYFAWRWISPRLKKSGLISAQHAPKVKSPENRPRRWFGDFIDRWAFLGLALYGGVIGGLMRYPPRDHDLFVSEVLPRIAGIGLALWGGVGLAGYLLQKRQSRKFIMGRIPSSWLSRMHNYQLAWKISMAIPTVGVFAVYLFLWQRQLFPVLATGGVILSVGLMGTAFWILLGLYAWSKWDESKAGLIRKRTRAARTVADMPLIFGLSSLIIGAGGAAYLSHVLYAGIKLSAAWYFNAVIVVLMGALVSALWATIAFERSKSGSRLWRFFATWVSAIAGWIVGSGIPFFIFVWGKDHLPWNALNVFHLFEAAGVSAIALLSQAVRAVPERPARRTPIPQSA